MESTIDFRIDASLKRQLMPLSPVEYSMLEESIVKDGCLQPLVVWDAGDGSVLIDGHNRYEICTRNEIDFDVRVIELADRDAAEDWIDRNQAARRNCKPEDFRILTGRIYNRRKKQHSEAGAMKSSPQFEVGSQTSDEVGREFGVSGATIERNAVRAEVFDDIHEQDEELADEIKTWPKQEVDAVAAVKKKIDEELPPCKGDGVSEEDKRRIEAEREQRRKEERLRVAAEIRAAKSAHVSLNTGMPEWYTPQKFIDAARSTMGEIDLDPATSVIAQETVKASGFFTIDDDGLDQPWRGRVWMNPPYTAGLVDRFANKLISHHVAGDVPQAIVLVNNSTETKWFQAIAEQSSAVCFPASRIKFLDENGCEGAPLQGQAILYLGSNTKGFIEHYGCFGTVWTR